MVESEPPPPPRVHPFAAALAVPPNNDGTNRVARPVGAKRRDRYRGARGSATSSHNAFGRVQDEEHVARGRARYRNRSGIIHIVVVVIIIRVRRTTLLDTPCSVVPRARDPKAVRSSARVRVIFFFF